MTFVVARAMCRGLIIFLENPSFGRHCDYQRDRHCDYLISIVIATIAIGGSLYISETLTTSLAMPRKSSGYATACRGHVAALVRVSSSNPFTGSYFCHLQ